MKFTKVFDWFVSPVHFADGTPGVVVPLPFMHAFIQGHRLDPPPVPHVDRMQAPVARTGRRTLTRQRPRVA